MSYWQGSKYFYMYTYKREHVYECKYISVGTYVCIYISVITSKKNGIYRQYLIALQVKKLRTLKATIFHQQNA